MPDQICWSGCPWSDKLSPVPEWDAVKTYKYDIESVHIKYCPLYKQGQRKDEKEDVKI